MRFLAVRAWTELSYVTTRAERRTRHREGRMKRIAIAILLAVCAFAGHAAAQSFPDRPITLINPYAAGGPADLLARTVADGMSEVLGRPVVVENRPGAGTAIGARA